MAENVVPKLFTDLNSFAQIGEYGKAQKIANKILKELPNDIDALKCKVVCLLHQSYFSEGLDVILSIERKGIIELPFEKAYCQYRLNDLTAALKTLKDIENPGLRERELLAQVLYRLEDYSACFELYRDLIKNSQDDLGDEREANFLAVVAAAKFWKGQNIGEAPDRDDTFELCYNYSSLFIAKGDLDKAQKKLEKAEDLCRKSLQDDPDLTEEELQEEIDKELGVIRAQMAYIKQLKGKTSESLKIYQQVLKSMKTKPSDADALAAVISNNIVTINKDKDVFDSKKKLRIMSANGLEHKLSRKQQEIIEMNKGLFNLFSNQIEACKKNITKLRETFESTENAALLEAAMLIRDKHPEQAIQSMKDMVESSDASSEIQLALAQLYLTKGKFRDAGNVLKSIEELRNTPAMVSFLVSLYTHLDDVDEAVQILNDAVVYFDKQGVDKELLIRIMRKNASYKMRHGLAKEALTALEQLRKKDPGDLKALAKIITAYSQINPKKAEEYSEHLPPFVHDDEIEVDVLESKHLMGSIKFSKKAQNEADQDNQAQRSELILKKKRKKKRKPRMPKSYNPDVDPDPERWLPRWERSTFKHKKQKRGQLARGPQGAVAQDIPTSPSARAQSSAAAASPSPVSSPQPGASSSSHVVPPRQQKPQAAKAKPKKKKKGGW
ncbi:signal recognition particle subunit SRP72-like [Rhopilema esculentum]|uniref:signal recognition particle subunit SRP72-like n=1 Tax=Rhopilema esculentum TaxID=499914 RepID=UPI0031DFC07B|eukprot:gene12355-3009_t